MRIYCDGSRSYKDNTMGVGVVVVHPNGLVEIYDETINDENASSTMAEMLAINKSIQIIIEKKYNGVSLFTDSMHAIEMVSPTKLKEPDYHGKEVLLNIISSGFLEEHDVTLHKSEVKDTVYSKVAHRLSTLYKNKNHSIAANNYDISEDQLLIRFSYERPSAKDWILSFEIKNWKITKQGDFPISLFYQLLNEATENYSENVLIYVPIEFGFEFLNLSGNGKKVKEILRKFADKKIAFIAS